jgi:hypothetical protein
VRIVVAVLACLVVVSIVLLTRGTKRAPAPARSAQPQSQTLEEKLAVLEDCGLRLAAPCTVDDLLRSWSRDKYEGSGFDLVLVGLGMTEEAKPWRSHCVNLWHFDTECIEDNGDYRRIAERMVEMSQGSLSLENIKDSVDVDGGKASLAFDFRGQPISITCKVNSDWVDPDVFGKFVDLLAQSDPSKIYIYYDLHGQDCIIGCVAKTDYERLKAKGIGFEPLR